MTKCYLNGIGSVSTQDSDKSLGQMQELKSSVNHAFKPNYRDYIKPVMIRRMAAGVKMGVVASIKAMRDAELKMPEAIVTGTGLGCLQDSEKFLKDIVNNDEQYLTPTSFIQSTHNTVGAQIALGLGCKSYNVTSVHGATSFESALIDARLLMSEGADHILVGGVDEISPYTTRLYRSINFTKKEDELTGPLLHSDSKGTIEGEGAQFFVLEKEKTNKSYAELLKIEIINDSYEGSLVNRMEQFLLAAGLTPNDIDVLLLGFNGDGEFDQNYREITNAMFQDAHQLYFKHLSGDYDTANSFELWASCKMIRDQQIPENMTVYRDESNGIEHLLIYNQSRDKYHSFTLLKRC